MCKWNNCRIEIAKTHPEKAKVSLTLFKHQIMKTNGGSELKQPPIRLEMDLSGKFHAPASIVPKKYPVPTD